MRTIHELAQWVEGAADEFGDPGEPICQIFARWVEPIASYRGDEIVAGILDGNTVIRLGPAAMLPLPLESNSNGTVDNEGVCKYGAKQITRGLWYLSPSLFLPGMIHAFVTLYGVPDSPPWERRIIVVPTFGDRAALRILRGGR